MAGWATTLESRRALVTHFDILLSAGRSFDFDMRRLEEYVASLQLLHIIQNSLSFYDGFSQVSLFTVLSAQKVLSGSDRGGRPRLMGKYIDHRLLARPEPDCTVWTDSTKDT